MFTYQVDEDITLELQAPHHAPLFYPLIEANRNHLDPYHGWVSHVHSVADMQQMMLRELKGMAQASRWAWLVRYRGEPAGRIAFWITIPEIKEFELSYWLAKSMTGKGIITKAVKSVLDFAFGELELNHALISYTERNIPSQKVAERLGFVPELQLRELGNPHEDSIEPLIFCGMLRSEWQAKTIPRFRYMLRGNTYLQLAEPRQATTFYRQTVATMADLKRWFVSMNFPYNLEREHRYIQRRLEGYALGLGLMVGIYDDDRLAGAMTLTIEPNNRSGQLGYWLAPAHRGKGLATQATQAMILFGFTHYQLNRIFLRVADDNLASIAVAERLGMQREAILRAETICQGQRLNHIVYGLLQHEWQAKHLKSVT